jgi:hypothetical protein
MVPLVIAVKEFRVRLKREEVEELKEALVRHIQRLVESRSIDWERYVLLRNLHYRLSRVGERRGGAPAKVYGFFASDEEMYKDMEDWVRYRIMEIENPEEYEKLRRKALLRLKRDFR